MLSGSLKSSLETNKTHYETHKNFLKEQDLKKSKFTHTHSLSVVNNWEQYAPFLVKTLGIENEEEKNKVLSMQFVEFDLWGSSDFLVKYEVGETYIHKYIKLFLFRDDANFHVCYFTAKSEQSLNERSIWDPLCVDHETLKYAIDFEISQVACNLFQF